MGKVLESLLVEHPYYCSDNNYFSNEPAKDYVTMTDFFQDFENVDVDMNLMFRWDFHNYEENNGVISASIYLMLQRKGIFMPISIKSVSEKEAIRFKKYAKRHWKNLQKMWRPIS